MPIPEVTTTIRRVAELIPASYNPRAIDQAALDGLRASIRRWGLVQPIVVNRRTGHVVGGHQRLKILHAEGVEETQVVEVDLDDKEERALNVTLNNPDIAGHYTDGLAALLDEIKAFDRVLFDDVRMGGLYSATDPPREGKTDEDDTPEPGRTSISAHGDLWILDDHRLLCGSTTSGADMAKLMGGELADLVVTDPPYNVDYKGAAGRIEGDNQTDPAFRAFLLDSYRTLLGASRMGAAIYVFHADTEGVNFRSCLTQAGWTLRQVLVWVKNAATLSRQDYNWRHEPVLYGWKPGAAHYYGRDFTQTTVIDDTIDPAKLSKPELVALVNAMREDSTVIYGDKPPKSDLHPTMKPVRILERLLNNSSKPGDLVLDGFGGSGSTMIAAFKARRRTRLMELDPKFCDVIVRRWQAFTGETAVLAGTAETFTAIEAARRDNVRRAG